MHAALQQLFDDVEPLEQDEGPVPIVRIQYDPAFVVLMNYFRRILVTQEYSERGLQLAKGVLCCHARAHLRAALAPPLTARTPRLPSQPSSRTTRPTTRCGNTGASA